ncbi:MAG: hypothetical protein WC322_07060 [Candidatus Paceibacterota bacterium]|jgi:hypothetical protein
MNLGHFIVIAIPAMIILCGNYFADRHIADNCQRLMYRGKAGKLILQAYVIRSIGILAALPIAILGVKIAF